MFMVAHVFAFVAYLILFSDIIFVSLYITTIVVLLCSFVFTEELIYFFSPLFVAELYVKSTEHNTGPLGVGQ
jgi:hypothetical protein